MDCIARSPVTPTRSRRGLQHRLPGVILATMLALPCTAFGAQQASLQTVPDAGRAPVEPTAEKTAVAVRTAEAPRIDGRLDEEIWSTAPAADGFWQLDPDEGEPGTEPTEFRVLYTDDALFIGVRAWDSEPDQIVSRLARRDSDIPSDWIVIAIDSYHDQRTGFAFFVNPVGVKRDMYLFDDGNDDESWDAVWDVGTSVDDEGWIAEFRIPFSQLRFSEGERQDFGFQVLRVIDRRNEEQHWRLMARGEAGLVSRFGDLTGIAGIKPPRRVELLPYVAASGDRYPGQDGNPFATGKDHTGRVGADLNLGLTSNLTLSATINPDFGQVEADPAVVNLTAFETFYPENRPFFQEGLDVFRFPILLGDGDGANEQLFYTRRIGRSPQGWADDRGGYAESIDQTTILGAAKLSGKTAGGWSMGFLSALTAEETARVIDGDGIDHADVVEPRSSYWVGSLARDFRGGLTQVGLFGTAVDRALPDNLQWLRSSAYSAALKFNHRFLDDRYHVDVWLAGTHVRGSEEAIDITQRSSARYYQRPDNDHVTYDPTRTSLTGLAGQFIVGKHAGDKLVWATGFDTRSPGFEVNDAGYQRQADRTIQFSWLQLRWLQPGKVFRRAQINFNQHSVWTWGWEKLGLGGNVNGWAQFRNYWSINAGISQNFPALSTGALRGGPALLEPYTWSAWGGFNSDSRKDLSVGANFSGFKQPESDSWGYDVGPQITWRAASNMDFTAGIGFGRQVDSWQYLTQVDALGDRHYVFGKLDQKTASMTFRGNVIFTPTLTLQLYAQPFVATGAYNGYREVSDPRGETFADRFTDYTTDQVVDDAGDIGIDLDRNGAVDIELGNPEFTYLSFRSNVVLRWEYMLGSTLFLVWQHGRFDVTDNDQFSLRQGIKDLFHLDSQNTFVLKFNYWLSL
jgi:hypothetical protein